MQNIQTEVKGNVLTITIKLDLNSYDRRIVHLEISGIDGVSSKSEEKDGLKFIQVIPNNAS